MSNHLVVLGAGYSGLIAAKLAARNADDDLKITLVNARDRFVERVRNHQLASGQRLPEHSLADLVHGTRIRLVVDKTICSKGSPVKRAAHGAVRVGVGTAGGGARRGLRRSTTTQPAWMPGVARQATPWNRSSR
ncbi:hypothetical protein [Flindersiella endophytica]